MTAEIISVGTELLLGNIVNTNAAYLAEKLSALGIECFYQTVVGDNRKRIIETLGISSARADLLILTGGLGAAEDDLTAEAVAAFCKVKITDGMPEGCKVFPNHNGTAAGIALLSGKCRFILLPGQHEELRAMFEESVSVYLRELSKGVILSQTVKICGISEDAIEKQLKDLSETENPTIATYAKTGEVHIRVTAKAETEKEATKLIKPVVKEIKSRFANDIYSTQDDVTLEKALSDLLQSADLTISCAESCTGGLLSGRLINVPGISEQFKAGLVAYSNKAKRKLLGVKKGTLQKYGAVSEQTVQEMVKGLVAVTKTDVGIAITGIAGPDGGTKEKPVGLVYIGCMVKGRVMVKECHFTGNREMIRKTTVATALMLARNCVLEHISRTTFGK